MAQVVDASTSREELKTPVAGKHADRTELITDSLEALLERTQALVEELAHRPNLGIKTAPQRELEKCAAIGLMTAPLPVALGGLGLGVLPGTQRMLLRLFALLGSADLPLGRLYEGHVNGLLLVQRYGTPAQVAQLAQDCAAGMLSGVWNTGGSELLKLIPAASGYRFEGWKTFATGASFVQRPIVTAEIPGRGWQMTLPLMEKLGASIDRSFWHPLGMESSESFGVDFTGGMVTDEMLIGKPGDFYLDPMFRGGAVRFASVQAGAILRLHAMFVEWLEEMRRCDDPYQIARLGEVAIAAQEAVLWIEKAASVAERSLLPVEKEHAERMIECANMMRTAIERQATRVMQLVITGVGAHGLLQPQRFERVIRDLTMYLRQPAPDQTLAAIGRASLEKAHKRADGPWSGFWNEAPTLQSLPPEYFRRIYDCKLDPWEFETSRYEREKYELTLASMPLARYENALEVGCSIGVLTKMLADRCERLLGLDVSERALERARVRCMDAPHVDFAFMQVPRNMPQQLFDLIMVSEVAYYWGREDLVRTADGLAERHRVGGHLVLVHLTEFVPDYPLAGDEVHDYWLTRPEWKQVHHARKERFRIDVMERTHHPTVPVQSRT